MVRDLNSVWEKEERRQWLFLRKKRKRRVKFLLEKFAVENVIDCVTEVEGITAADQSLPSTFSSNPRCYGGVQLTKDEEKVLCLPPKFAVYEKIDLMSCEAQIEKGLGKLRLSALRKADDETSDAGEREVGQEEERAWPFDMENGAFDLRYLRPTELPFNKRVCLPTALKDGKEIDMQHLKGKLMRVTEEYLEEQGKRVAKGNLTHEEQRGLRSLRSQENAIVFQTYKSGRFVVDTVDNYRDRTVTGELHERVQAELMHIQFCG